MADRGSQSVVDIRLSLREIAVHLNILLHKQGVALSTQHFQLLDVYPFLPYPIVGTCRGLAIGYVPLI